MHVLRPVATAVLLLATYSSAGASGDTDLNLEGVSESVGASRDPISVFTLTNETKGNAVMAYRRTSDGRLIPSSRVYTGGRGSGEGLGSQGALALSANGRWLFAVNAGSNEVSSFRVGRDNLTLRSIVGSGGENPISLTVHDEWLYVLNAGGKDGGGNITGFTVDDGRLVALPNSTRSLSGMTQVGPAQLQFNTNGTLLVVTEKMTNKIDTYVVNSNGLADGPTVTSSSGETPFGFAFNRYDTLVVSEAFGGGEGASAASSYALSDEGAVTTVTASVPNSESAACWVTFTRNGRYAYVSNTGSGSISAYYVTQCGCLSLLDPRAGETGTDTMPIDMATVGNDFLYVLNSGTHTIRGFSVATNGSLSLVSEVTGLPPAAVGLAARSR